MSDQHDWVFAAQAAALPMLRLRLNGDIEEANTAAAALFGRSSDELRAAKLEALLSAGGRMLYHTQFMPTLRVDGRAAGLTLMVRDGGGTEQRVLAYASMDESSSEGVTLTLILTPARTGRELEDDLFRIRRAADASPGMLFEYLVDAQGRGRFGYASAAVVTLFGLTPDVLRTTDEPLLDRVFVDDRLEFLSTRSVATHSQAPWSVEFRTRPSQDDAWRNLSWTATPRAQPQGATIWHGVATDVTQQRSHEARERERELAQRADAARREAEVFTKLVADTLPGRVTYWDRDLVCRFANGQFCAWLGRAPSNVIGQPARELLSAERHELLVPVMDKAFEGAAQQIELKELDADGLAHWRLVSIIPDKPDGRVRGAIVLAIDVTLLKQSEQQLRRVNQELERALDRAEEATRSKSAFLANMSHEIRTPMNAIIGLTHLMSRDSADTLQRERLGKVSGAANHLLQIINDVLDLSKIEAGKVVLEETEFDFDALLAGAFDLVSARAREKGLELVLDTDSVPLRLRGDSMRLSQALVNLLSNAVKFTARGWIRLRARVERRAGDGILIRFEVTDTGEGIAPENQARLFQSFEQADASTTRRHGGTGLGLSITRHLATLMGGDAGLDSILGQGSTFWFTALLRRTAEAGDFARPLDLTGLRALLVDDLPEASAVIADQLRLFGISVTTCDSGQSACEALRMELRGGRSFDVFLIDWQMAPMDGFETLEALHELLGDGAPPCILVTAFDEPIMRGKALAHHCDAVMVKPVTPSALHDTLARVLRPHSAAPVAVGRNESSHESALRRHHGGQRVLLAEDNLINQEVARELLGSAGLVVETASDGTQAIELATTRAYDLILMDVQMPRIDGLEATQRIRARIGSACPIVAMTANAFGEDRAACLRAGMNDHISKPVDPELLYGTLLRWLPGRAAAGNSTMTTAKGVGTSLVEFLSDVDGFDVAAGLQNVGGSTALLERMLHRFIATYGDGEPALSRLDTPEARRAASHASHSLRGSSATVGATTLVLSLQALEAALSKDSELSSLQALGRDAQLNLSKLVEALAHRLDRHGSRSSAGA